MTAVDPNPAAVTVPPLSVIPGEQVAAALNGRERQVMDLVEETHRVHGAGDSAASCELR